MSYIHVCAPDPIIRKAVFLKCPTCKTKRRFLAECYEWYGATLTCLTCGDIWNDGELKERPHRHAWRTASVYNAKQRLAIAKRDAALQAAGSEVTDLDDLPHFCGVCHRPLEHVRPGKWQCNSCEAQEG